MVCSGLEVLFHGYYYFSPRVSFFPISDGLGDFTQLITLVDDRCDLSGQDELRQDGQVLWAGLREKRDKAPPQQGDFAFCSISAQAHDRLSGLRSDVVRLRNLERRRNADAKGLRNPLLLCPVLVSPARD